MSESMTKMQRELVAVTEERDRLAARVAELEAAEAKLREQKPVAYVKYKATGGNVGLSWLAVPTGEFYPREGEPLYAAPVPAVAAPAVPAPSVPNNEFVQHLKKCKQDVESWPEWKKRAAGGAP